MNVTAIIAAAGRGQRFGGPQLKQLVPVGGRPMLERTVAAFLAHPSVDELVVALPPELADNPPACLRGVLKPLRIVTGGARRQDSVARAFGATSAASDIIVIHDAARPFASADLITRTIAAAAETGAALAAIASSDTVKLALRRAQGEREAPSLVPGAARDERPAHSPVSGAFADERVEPSLLRSPSKDERVFVKRTLPRDAIFLAQTPQAFRRETLQAAIAAGEREDIEATDEAALVEGLGSPVQIVDGESSNIKITTPEDLVVAEAIAETLRIAEGGGRTADGPRDPESAIRNQSAIRSPQSAMPVRTGRAGTGYDLHRLVAGRLLVIGGITIPSDRGALGHSDADVVCHAIADAILGAACLGDIGQHFPDTDPRWKDASSLDLLSRVAALAAEQGFEIGNVDVTIVLEAPRLRDHVGMMRAAVARAIDTDVARVSIKAKTTEGVDAIGRGEAIAAHAVALLRSIH
jgi:2-C-methyl-D-erythritol 4-phosphate cytidylyltransferase/2-C-methyl-D-erythritol 2,4-cyclodiphosphate synthase